MRVRERLGMPATCEISSAFASKSVLRLVSPAAWSLSIVTLRTSGTERQSDWTITASRCDLSRSSAKACGRIATSSP